MLYIWESNIAMENGPFEDVFPIKNGIYSIAIDLGIAISSTHIKINKLFHL